MLSSITFREEKTLRGILCADFVTELTTCNVVAARNGACLVLGDPESLDISQVKLVLKIWVTGSILDQSK